MEPKEKGLTASVLLSEAGAVEPKENGFTASVFVVARGELDSVLLPKEKGLTSH